MNILVIIVIGVISIFLGYVSYSSSTGYDSGKDARIIHKNATWQWVFREIWNNTLSFIFAGSIGYYFVTVRMAKLFSGESFISSDLILFLLFAMCLLGWFPYLLKNFTEGVNAILQRAMGK